MRFFRRHATLLLICLTSAGWAFSFGLSANLVSLSLDQSGFAKADIGWNHGAYYLGMALASAAVPWLMRRWGSRCIVAGMFAAAISAGLIPWGGGLAGWFLLRLANGMAGALCLIPLET